MDAVLFREPDRTHPPFLAAPDVCGVELESGMECGKRCPCPEHEPWKAPVTVVLFLLILANKWAERNE